MQEKILERKWILLIANKNIYYNFCPAAIFQDTGVQYWISVAPVFIPYIILERANRGYN